MNQPASEYDQIEIEYKAKKNIRKKIAVKNQLFKSVNVEHRCLFEVFSIYRIFLKMFYFVQKITLHWSMRSTAVSNNRPLVIIICVLVIVL